MNGDLKCPFLLNKKRRLGQLAHIAPGVRWAESCPKRLIPSILPALIDKNRPKLLRTCSSSVLNTFSPALRWFQYPECVGSAQIYLGALQYAQCRSSYAMLGPSKDTLAVLTTSYSKQRAQKGWGVRWAEPPLYHSDPTRRCLRRWEFSVKCSGKRKRSVAVVYQRWGLLRVAECRRCAWTVTSGHCLLEANCSWQLFSFHPMVKTATLKRTSLCKMSNHKIFVSSFPESRHKSDSEVIKLCWIKKECSVLWIQCLLSK